MMSDFSHSLLKQYQVSRSEEAFCHLVTHYMPLVYSTALRRTQYSSDLAEEVAGEVFRRLAKKAGQLNQTMSLGGWLYRQTCRISANHVRTESRRRKREMIAIEMMKTSEPTPDAALLSELDEALLELPKPTRDVLILRFFEEESHREVGTRLGVSEEAARKRVNRALEALRGIFEKRGLKISVPMLVAALTGLNTKTLSAAATALIAQDAFVQWPLQSGLGFQLASLVAGVMTVSVVALGMQRLQNTSKSDDVVITRNSPIVANSRSEDRFSTDHSPKDFIARIKQACQGPENVNGQILIRALLEEIDNHEIPNFIENSHTILSRIERERCYSHLLQRWIMADPVTALDYCLHSSVFLFIERVNPKGQEQSPSGRFLARMTKSWRNKRPQAASDWLRDHWTSFPRTERGEAARRVLADEILWSFYANSQDATEQLAMIKALPEEGQLPLLKSLYGMTERRTLQRSSILPLAEHWSTISDESVRGVLGAGLWPSWASDRHEEMLKYLRQLEGKDAFQARLALIADFSVSGTWKIGANGTGYMDKAGTPYATLAERERDALDAGIAAGLEETAVERTISLWLIDNVEPDRADVWLRRLGPKHGLDEMIEERVRTKLSHPRRWGKGEDAEIAKLALLLDDQEQALRIVRAIFQENLHLDRSQSSHIGNYFLKQLAPSEPIRRELESLMASQK